MIGNRPEAGRRRGPWVMAGMLAVFIIIVIAIGDDVDDSTSDGEVLTPYSAPGTMGPNAADLLELQRLVDFSKQPPDFGDVNRAHEYTRNGLLYLADAVERVARPGASPRAKVAALREAAAALGTRTPVDHADLVGIAFLQAADALEELQRGQFPWLHVDAAKVRTAAEAIEQDGTLLSQVDRVKTFFGAAANILQLMGAKPAPAGDRDGKR